ncbi:hypothetical protein [Haloarcula sp. JP-L23]
MKATTDAEYDGSDVLAVTDRRSTGVDEIKKRFKLALMLPV